MISEKDREAVLDLVHIEEVIAEDGVKLKKHGHLYEACCPFHNEDTPSFKVDAEKNFYHCYGCGANGDAVKYVMLRQNKSYPEAIQHLAKKYRYTIEESEQTEEQKQADIKKRTQKRINAEATKFFQDCLRNNKEAWAYATSRWSEDAIEHWSIGYAPEDSFALWRHLLEMQFKVEDLEDSPLFTCKKDEQFYCVYWDRITFPIFSNVNEVIAFSARVLHLTADNKKYKYINSRNSILYNKTNTLYGWNFALREIAKTNTTVLVEGNADVIKLHEIGINNAVAVCGTSFNDKHAQMIGAKAKTAVMMFDGDAAGINATLNNGHCLLKAGIIPYVLALPTTDAEGKPQKNDPDSFFTSRAQYDEYFIGHKEHYILWLTHHKMVLANNPDPSDTAAIMSEVCEEMMFMPEVESEAYIPQLSKICGTPNQWTKLLNQRRNISTKKGTKKLNEQNHTEHQQETLDTYGFYEEENCYHIDRGNYESVVSNFVMQPLFHIESSITAKRLYRIVNNRGVVRDIEIAQKDLCSKAAFCNCVESRGNFLFTGSDSDLAKIKSYLYDNTKSCIEITQLGWQSEGRFWAWSNGIYTTSGKFIPVDEYGCIEYNKQWYYMPACSSTTAQDKGFYRYERRFIHQPSNADLFTWASKFMATFGENAIMGICYFITCMYRDLAMEKYRSFPLMDIFGQRGSGKTKFVMSLLRLFGKDCEEGPNIGSDTVPAIADQMSKTFNGFVHLDEYKNNIDPVKIEMLKGAYENRGRGKMDMEHDKKRMRTPMDCGVILSGQEMTTADNALFSRVVYLTFNKTRFTPEQVDTFEDLKTYEERSLTPITNKILTLRPWVEEVYDRCCDEVKADMRKLVNSSKVEERIIKNYSIILSIMKAVDGKVSLPFTYKELLPLFVRYIDRQNNTVSATSEIADFWGGIETLLTNGNIDIDYDIIIRPANNLVTYMGTGSDRRKKEYSDQMLVLYLNTSRVFSEYMMLVKRTKTNLQNQCDITALKSYLTTQDEFLGDSKAYFLKPMKNSQDPHKGETFTGENAGQTALRKQSRCLCFNYAKLREEYGIDFYITQGFKANPSEAVKL